MTEIRLRFWDDFEEKWIDIPGPVEKIELIIGGHIYRISQVEGRLGKFCLEDVTTKNTTISVIVENADVSFQGKVEVY